MERLDRQMRYREIASGYGNHRVVVGYEVSIRGQRGCGATLDEATRDAELRASTYEARVERMQDEAFRLSRKRRAALGADADADDIPF